MKTRVNNQTKNADNDELPITLLFNNQTGQKCSYMGNRSRGAQQVKYVGNTDVFYFGFNFMSPKWTRTKFINDCDNSVPTGLMMPTACTEVLRAPLHIS